MAVEQMRSEIRASFLHDIALSANPIFMAQQLKQRFTDEMLNIIMEGETSEEKEALRKELDRRIQTLEVSSNSTKAIIEVQ
jgi:uncharacterized lipoprotein